MLHSSWGRLAAAAGFLVFSCLASVQADTAVIPYPIGVETKIAGAASAPVEINHTDSPYFASPDFYTMTSNDHLTILSRYATYQQTTEESCGPAAALTVLHYLGDTSSTEASLYKGMKTRPYPVGTNPKDMVAFLRSQGWRVRTSLESKPFETYETFQRFVLQKLQAGLPIMVENVEWGGHWRVIIGYDTMGTASSLDDVLILADPYDTCDHKQDGYVVANGEKFYSMWFDHYMLPKDQRNQPWIVVQPVLGQPALSYHI